MAGKSFKIHEAETENLKEKQAKCTFMCRECNTRFNRQNKWAGNWEDIEALEQSNVPT